MITFLSCTVVSCGLRALGQERDGLRCFVHGTLQISEFVSWANSMLCAGVSSNGNCSWNLALRRLGLELPLASSDFATNMEHDQQNIFHQFLQYHKLLSFYPQLY